MAFVQARGSDIRIPSVHEIGHQLCIHSLDSNNGYLKAACSLTYLGSYTCEMEIGPGAGKRFRQQSLIILLVSSSFVSARSSSRRDVEPCSQNRAY